MLPFQISYIHLSHQLNTKFWLGIVTETIAPTTTISVENGTIPVVTPTTTIPKTNDSGNILSHLFYSYHGSDWYKSLEKLNINTQLIIFWRFRILKRIGHPKKNLPEIMIFQLVQYGKSSFIYCIVRARIIRKYPIPIKIFVQLLASGSIV